MLDSGSKDEFYYVSLLLPILKLFCGTQACTKSALHVAKFSSTITAKLGSPDSSVSIVTRLGLEETGFSPGKIKGILFVSQVRHPPCVQ